MQTTSLVGGPYPRESKRPISMFMIAYRPMFKGIPPSNASKPHEYLTDARMEYTGKLKTVIMLLAGVINQEKRGFVGYCNHLQGRDGKFYKFLGAIYPRINPVDRSNAGV